MFTQEQLYTIVWFTLQPEEAKFYIDKLFLQANFCVDFWDLDPSLQKCVQYELFYLRNMKEYE